MRESNRWAMLVLGLALAACSDDGDDDGNPVGTAGSGGNTATGSTGATGGTGTAGAGTGGNVAMGGAGTAGAGTGGAGTAGTGTGGTESGGAGAGGAETGGSSGGPIIGRLALLGVNLAGAEFGSSERPGTFGTNYIWPDDEWVDGYDSPTYFVSKGMTVFRLPFLWERIQHALNEPLDPDELERLQSTVAGLRATGAYVILDPHNYGRYYGEMIGSGAVTHAAFGDFWSRLASLYLGDSGVIFGLMNEPYGMETETWVTSANTAIGAIRDVGANNLILVPGNHYTNANGWNADWYGTPNSVAMLDIVDPGDNYAFEVHNYFNADASHSDECISPTIGVERLEGVTTWLRTHGLMGFVGEFSGQNNADCEATVQNMLDHIHGNSDVWLGWSWWAAGPWWGDSFESIEPDGTTDDPRMSWLAPYL